MYIGAQPFTKASYNNVEVLATEGQTAFNVSYQPNFVDVLVNGVELSKTDYVALNGTSIVLNEPLALNDVVVFKVWGTFQTADAVATGGGSQTVLGEKTFEDFRLLEDVNGDKLIKDSSGLTLATFDSEGKLNANNGLSYVGGAILVNGLSAIFTNTTNNINAVGIGVGVEVGDVIQISGSVNNKGEFTIEVITDANNVIVNQAHAGGTTSKALVDETATVTVKLLCKWYLVREGLGQDWVNVTSSRVLGGSYTAPANRDILVSVNATVSVAGNLFSMTSDGDVIGYSNASGNAGYNNRLITSISGGAVYRVGSANTLFFWSERR